MNSIKPAILLTFDIEEFDVPEEHGIALDFETKMAVSRPGVERILAVLEKHPHVRATFFVTSAFATAAQDLLTRMSRCGEIASHGVNHTAFSPGDLAASRATLSSLSGTNVTGFRMPRMAVVSDQALLDAGYSYDSSSNPTFIPGRYCALRAPASAHKKASGLVEVPASVSPTLRLPLFWLSFKNFPFFFFRFLAARTLKKRGFLNLYSHPWEYSARINEKQFKMPFYMKRYAGPPLAERLEKLILFLQTRGEFLTLSAYLKQQNLL